MSGLSHHILEALDWIGLDRTIEPGLRVFVKPNLTWPEPTPGVTTSPQVIEAVVAALLMRTNHVTIGESDGGYHSFQAEESFEGHGVYDIARRYGAQVVNLSRLPSECVDVTIGSQTVTVELPSLLLHEVDLFVTVPVPKVHAMTRVSMGFKNQWGCIPNTMRLRNHSRFDQKIVAINKLLKPRLAIYDGTYFLDKNGPMQGEPVRMDLLIAADDIGAGDAVCCYLMRVDPERVSHLKVARAEGMFPRTLDEVLLNQPIEPFRDRPFQLKRNVINWIALMAFNHGWFTRLLYDSAFADPVHRILYAIRRNSLIGRALYGELGPPAASGKSRVSEEGS